MDQVRVLVLGLGNFGHSWADRVVPSCGDCAVLSAVVEQDEEKWKGIPEEIPRFRDLESALAQERPNLVINVTPPAVHCEINEWLLNRGIPVLCEKPIADSLESALQMKQALQKSGGFLMIGENYRYHPVFRAAGRILASGELGVIHRLECRFRHYHPDYSRFYHGSLAHPLLEDVAVHHLDLARYLTGQEPVRVWCREDAAPYSWYQNRPASAAVIADMTGGVVFHYDGTLASPQSTTDWNGDWEVECDRGVLRISQGHILLYRDDKVYEPVTVEEVEDSRSCMLREACMALREGRKAETDFEDNFKSFRFMRKAVQAAENGNWTAVEPE